MDIGTLVKSGPAFIGPRVPVHLVAAGDEVLMLERPLDEAAREYG